MKQKVWGVVLILTGKINDTSSISFTRAGAENWKRLENKKFNFTKKLYKVVKLEIEVSN